MVDFSEKKSGSISRSHFLPSQLRSMRLDTATGISSFFSCHPWVSIRGASLDVNMQMEKNPERCG